MRTAFIIDAGGLVTNTILVDDSAKLGEFGAIEGPDGVGIGWTKSGSEWIAPPNGLNSLDALRATKIGDIVAAADALLKAGAPVSNGLHVALDDGSRADLTAMATTATAAASGAIPWPESYSRGWITIENLRIQLATPTAGLTLAASAGDYYAALVQHRRDLKDAALAATDAATLDAIDVTAGWPD